MSLKIVVLIFVGLVSLAISFLREKNKEKEKTTKKKMLDRLKKEKEIQNIKESDYKNYKISEYIIQLIEDYEYHTDIGNKLTNEEIENIEQSLNLKFPVSYKIFLKYFGDGGYWIYTQSIDSVNQSSWLSQHLKNLEQKIELENEKEIEVSSLFCLMSEDSNGGAWCWLTSEKNKNGEFPLAYYIDEKLHYKVESFTEWLRILIENRSEVIFVLDTDYKLGLG